MEASMQATQKTLILSEKHTKQHKTQSCRREDELHADESDDEMLLRMNKDTIQSCDEMLEWMDEVFIPLYIGSFNTNSITWAPSYCALLVLLK